MCQAAVAQAPTRPSERRRRIADEANTDTVIIRVIIKAVEVIGLHLIYT
jgi:hypothetical protein